MLANGDNKLFNFSFSFRFVSSCLAGLVLFCFFAAKQEEEGATGLQDIVVFVLAIVRIVLPGRKTEQPDNHHRAHGEAKARVGSVGRSVGGRSVGRSVGGLYLRSVFLAVARADKVRILGRLRCNYCNIIVVKSAKNILLLLRQLNL